MLARKRGVGIQASPLWPRFSKAKPAPPGRWSIRCDRRSSSPLTPPASGKAGTRSTRARRYRRSRAWEHRSVPLPRFPRQWDGRRCRTPDPEAVPAKEVPVQVDGNGLGHFASGSSRWFPRSGSYQPSCRHNAWALPEPTFTESADLKPREERVSPKWSAAAPHQRARTPVGDRRGPHSPP